MSYDLKSAVVLALTLTSVHGHLAFENPEFQPVQGLYVKPSSDGTTGDLYVAATEDNGVKTQWLTDQPVNFLQSATQLKPSVLPLFSSGLSGNALPLDELTNQKRAALTGVSKFSYGLSSGSDEGNPTSYSYSAIQASQSEPTQASETPVKENAAVSAAYPHYSPYHYFYPHMMSAAYASAFQALKAAGSGDEATNSNSVASHPAPMWPSAYYPVQYVMMDPAAWAKQHAAALQSTTAATTAPSVVSTSATESTSTR